MPYSTYQLFLNIYNESKKRKEEIESKEGKLPPIKNKPLETPPYKGMKLFCIETDLGEGM